MLSAALKCLLPNRPIPMRILRGPFRGARLMMIPRDSMRKVLGLYEHELNDWLEQALRQVTRVLDVGANDGYFTFGCAAAFRRLSKTGEIIAFEPMAAQVELLRASVTEQANADVRFSIIQGLVGGEDKAGMTSLDSVRCGTGRPNDRANTLVKIDVEGDEVSVLEGALTWLAPSNRFVIEVHEERFLDRLKEIFAEKGLRLRQVDQRPLRWLGGEVRGKKNWWLVSDLCSPHANKLGVESPKR